MKLDITRLRNIAEEAGQGMSVKASEKFRDTFNPLLVSRLLRELDDVTNKYKREFENCQKWATKLAHAYQKLELAEQVCEASTQMGAFFPHFVYCGMMEGDDCTCGVREFTDALACWEKHNETRP